MAPLPSLPPELLLLIADKLPTRDISVLSRTSQNIHALLTPLLERRFTAEATSILCWAVPRKRIALIKRALSNGADLTCQSYEEPWTRGIPLLALTVINSDIPVTKLLLEAGADINQTHPYLFNDPPVIYAYNLNDNNMVRLLQRYGGRLPQPDPSEYFILRDSWGFGIV